MGPLILAGDFNHADLRSVFPKIHQHIDFPTRGRNTLDFVYTTQRGAYKALPLPHLGASDHITVMLMPAYRPLVKAIKPVHKQIQVWPEGSSEALQDCFDTTDWDMFKQAATYNNTTDLQEYSETVTAYITKCIDDVTVTKPITVRANQKPWLTGEVYRLLKARNAAFTFTFYIYAFSRRFYPKRLTLHSSYSFTFYQLLLSLGIEPMILALLAPCSTI